VGGKGVFRVTGPIAYTLAIAPLLNLHQHRFADSDNDLGFEYSILRTNKAKVHKGLFKRHYSDLLDPIIKIEGRGPLALWFIRTVNRIRHRLEKRAR
jgi:inositol phosphorylceramide mannosyltransferase catalytic subunit